MRVILIAAVLAGALASEGNAGRIEDSIVQQLRAQGFSRVEVTRTWLGRSRIVAKSSKYNREIIVNPVTGEILRDYVTERNGSGLPSIFNPNRGRDSEEYNADPDDDDGEDDDGYYGDDDGDYGDDGEDGEDGGDGDSDGEGGGDDGGEGGGDDGGDGDSDGEGGGDGDGDGEGGGDGDGDGEGGDD